MYTVVYKSNYHTMSPSILSEDVYQVLADIR
jgi:hypothetical protein